MLDPEHASRHMNFNEKRYKFELDKRKKEQWLEGGDD
jgi:hypothetical protein